MHKAIEYALHKKKGTFQLHPWPRPFLCTVSWVVGMALDRDQE